MAQIKLKTGLLKRYRFRQKNYDAGQVYEVSNDIASGLMNTGYFEPVVSYYEDEDDSQENKKKKKKSKVSKQMQAMMKKMGK